MRGNMVRTQAVLQIQKEAKRWKTELQDYLEDLELFSNREFWKAVQSKKRNHYKGFEEFRKKMGF